MMGSSSTAADRLSKSTRSPNRLSEILKDLQQKSCFTRIFDNNSR